MFIIDTIKKFFKHRSFRNQLLLLLLLLSQIPILIILGFTMSMSSEIIEQQIKKNSQQTIEQISDNISSMLSLIAATSISVTYNETVQLSLTHRYKQIPLSQFQKYTLEKSLISFYDYSIIRDIFLYISDDESYYVPYGMVNRSREMVDEYTLGTTPFSPKWRVNQQYDILHLLRPVENERYYYIMGILCIGISLDTIRGLFSKVNFGQMGEIALIDQDNNIVTSVSATTNMNEQIKALQPLLKEDSGTFLHTWKGKEYMMFYHSSKSTNWKTIGLVSMDAMFSDLTRLRLTIIGVFIITFASVIICASLVSGYFYHSISKIIRAMEKVSLGNFSIRMEEDENQEFNIIHGHFNLMVEKIDHLIESVYKTELLLRKTELRMLQAQINPHFLYNTLDTIFWQASIAKQDNIAKTVISLSNLMRMSVNDKSFITVREEMEYVENYLFIQKQRYQNKINTIIEIDKNLESVLIPKLIIQPFVENAIVHGLESETRKWNIRIEGHYEGNDCRFTINDNGRGMSAEQITAVFSEREEQRISGILNIHKRIQIQYGDKYGLKIISVPGEYTSVSLLVPPTFSPSGGEGLIQVT